MVIKFKNSELKADLLKRAMTSGYQWGEECYSPDGNGIPYNVFELKQRIHLNPDMSLYADDNMDQDTLGQFLKILRGHGFHEEDADVIVPRVYPPLPDDCTPPSSCHCDDKPDDDDPDNIVDLDDLHPEIHDDGNFEREILEIQNESWSDDDE